VEKIPLFQAVPPTKLLTVCVKTFELFKSSAGCLQSVAVSPLIKSSLKKTAAIMLKFVDAIPQMWLIANVWSECEGTVKLNRKKVPSEVRE
jgi:hypothetical protein